MKKLISLLLSVIIFASALTLNGAITVFAKSEKYIVGDTDGNGIVESQDALLALNSTVGKVVLTDAQNLRADVNCDGKTDSSDVLAILQICVGLLPSREKFKIDYSDYPTLDPQWVDTVLKNYDEFIGEVSSDSNKIPFIISTDQHGLIKRDCEVFKFINDFADWNRISKIISLGDTVTLIHNDIELKNFSRAMQYVPAEKRLELEGNHDSHISLVRYNMEKYFIAPGAVKSKNNEAFTVEDKDFNVRYLTVNPMNYPWTYKSGRIGTEQADFIVAELEKKGAGDIVLLSHTYLFRDEIIKRDGTAFTGSDYFIGNEKKGADVKQSFVDMLSARKNRTSGVFIDSDGVKHPYNFSECKGDLLMTLHGHHHTEGYETKNGITEFLFQSFAHNGSDDDNEPNCFYFAYIDRENHTFKCWKNISGYSAWEIEIV